MTLSINIKHLFFSVLLICLNSSILAQQFLQSGLYMMEPYSQIPAFAGMSNDCVLTGNFRKQWNAIPGAPTSQFVTAHLPLYSLQSGLGVTFINDELGASNNVSGHVAYNYIFSGFDFGLISGGLTIGLNNRTLDGSRLRTPDGQYNTVFNHEDPKLLETRIGSLSYFTDVSLAFKNEKIEAGFTFNRIFFQNVGKSDLNFDLDRSMIFYGSYVWALTDLVKINPNFLLKFSSRVTQFEFDFSFFYGAWFGGIGCRGYDKNSIDALKIYVGGAVIKNINLVYGYESPLGGFKINNNNTHELGIQYRISSKRLKFSNPPIIFHPRM